MPDTEDQYVFQRWSTPLLWIGPWTHFGVWIPLAVFGVWVSASRTRKLALLYFLPITYGASVVAFYVMARYRLPLVPFLLLFGAVGICEARQFWRSSGRGQLAGVAVLVTAAALFCNQSVMSSVPRLALAHYNLGSRLRTLGELEQASEHLRISLSHKRLPQAHENLAVILQSQGERDEAIEQYRLAIEMRPNAFVHAQLATLLLDSDQKERAIHHYARSIALEPTRVDVRLEYAALLRDTGDLEAAKREFAKAIEIQRKLQRAAD